ncbi:D-alanyl-D-alanine carboxypeptidase, partial [Acinetobacter baumannii]
MNGVLQGNLYLQYDGDPTLQLSDMNALFRTLAQQGIRTVQGSFYVDTTRYDNHGVSPGTEDHDRAYCYGAPVNA